MSITAQEMILEKSELNDAGKIFWRTAMEATVKELGLEGVTLNDLQAERLGVHMVALVDRQQKQEFFPDLDEELMGEVSSWGWQITEKVTKVLDTPEWKASKTEQFLLAIHFESAKVENG